MNKAIIIGHNSVSKGAYSEHLGMTEWDFFKSFEGKLKEVGDVFIHDPEITGYLSRCIDISSRIGDNYDLIIALHFNMFNGEVGGCEVWHWHKNKKGENIAKVICEKVNTEMGISNRGAKKIVSHKQRGGGEVFYPKATSLLLEPFFGDSEEDCRNFDIDKFVEIIKSIK